MPPFGLFIVICCVWPEYRYNITYLDGLASLLVGLLQVGVHLVLARESHSLLMGEGVTKKDKELLSLQKRMLLQKNC
jgi:uncharacterized membrane protein YqjE